MPVCKGCGADCRWIDNVSGRKKPTLVDWHPVDDSTPVGFPVAYIISDRRTWQATSATKRNRYVDRCRQLGSRPEPAYRIHAIPSCYRQPA